MNCKCCKGCDKRKLGCHSECEEYSKFKNEKAREAEVRKEYYLMIAYMGEKRKYE